jgi:hypothetical protein
MTNEGKPWILPVVKKAEQVLLFLLTSLRHFLSGRTRGKALDPARGEEG